MDFNTFTNLFKFLFFLFFQLDVILPNLSRYDVCPEIPANGYRSLLKIIQKCCMHLLQLCRHITINRDSVLFRIVHYARELECYVAVLGQLRACLYFSCQLMAYCPKDSLFIDKDGLKDPIAFRLLKEFDSLSQDCFYGRCLGFQVSLLFFLLASKHLPFWRHVDAIIEKKNDGHIE